MPIKILMPALSPTMTEGTIAKWLKKEGDEVFPGEVIAEIETDKATMEVETIDKGVVAKIFIPGGTSGVIVNRVIAILKEDGDSDEEINGIILSIVQGDRLNISEEHINQNNSFSQNLAKEVMIESQNNILEQRRIFISPLAKIIAEKEGIKLTSLKGTGPNGRIVRNDVLKFITNNPISMNLSRETTKDQQDAKIENIDIQSPKALSCQISINSSSMQNVIPISGMRKVIAQRLVESKQEVPHFYLSISCEISELLELRQQINTKGDNKYKISINDLIVKAAALAISDVPEVNVSWTANGILQHSSIDIAFAVALNDGLITPIVCKTNTKSLSTISFEIKELADRAKNNKLKLDEYQGGSCTISNLGMYGMESFFAIINPPQSFILAIGAVIEKPVIQNGQLAIGKVLSINMSCDHRVIDGAVGAKYCAALQKYLTNPMLILV